MKSLTAVEIMDLADAFASDLLQHAEEQGIHPRDLMVASVISHKLLQLVLTPNPMDALSVVQEADATFTASSRMLEAN